MNVNTLTKKILPSFLLAGLSFALYAVYYVILTLRGYIPFFYIFTMLLRYLVPTTILLCVLPTVVLLTQRSLERSGKPLFYTGLVLLGLQALGNVVYFFSALFGFSLPYFLDLIISWIPGSGLLSQLVYTFKDFSYISGFFDLILTLFSRLLLILTQLCALASTLWFLLACSEFSGFHPLDALRTKLYRLLKIKDAQPVYPNAAPFAAAPQYNSVPTQQPRPQAPQTFRPPVTPTVSRPVQNGNTGDVIGQLEKLGQLHNQGILTDEEFNAKKAELLKRI